MHTPDSLPTTAPRRGRSFVNLGLMAFALLTLYFLSPPPLMLLGERFPVLRQGPADHILQFVYAPLFWVCDNIPAVPPFYQWYFYDVWGFPELSFTFDDSDIVESLSVTHSTNAPPQ